MCAERRLLQKCIQDAQRHGVPSHKIAYWIHRKNTNIITIARWRGDGSFGCSVPCISCRKELCRYGFRVKCFTADGHWFDGYLNDNDAPSSKMTSGQKQEKRERQARR